MRSIFFKFLEYRFFFFAFAIVFSVAFFLGLSLPAFAAIDQGQNLGLTDKSFGFTNFNAMQSFTPTVATTSQIKVEMKYYNTSRISGLTAIICIKSTVPNQTCSNGTKIYEKVFSDSETDVLLSTSYQNIDILQNNSINTSSTTKYWFILNPACNTSDCLYIKTRTDSDTYLGGDSYYSNGVAINYDFNFLTYYEEFTNPDVYVVDLDNQLGLTEHDLVFDRVNFCSSVATSTCYINFKYNSFASNDTFYLYWYDVGTQTASTTILATSSVTYSPDVTGKISVPIYSGTEPVTYYCVKAVDPTYSEPTKTWCGISVNWVTTDKMLEYFSQLTPYDISTACNSMDSSASTTFTYGIECGFRKVGYWLVTPSIDSQLKLLQMRQKSSDIFPINIYSQIKDSFLSLSNTIATSTASSTDWSIPLMWGTTDTGVHILDSNSIKNSPINSVWVQVNNIFSTIIYLMVFVGILHALTAKKENNDVS